MIYPNSHYVTTKDKVESAITRIEEELEERVKYFKENEKYVEAQRIAERTHFDMEMLRATGFCQGIVDILQEEKRGQNHIHYLAICQMILFWL